MPIMMHRTREALDQTIKAYRELVSKVKEKEKDPDSPLLINLSLALPGLETRQAFKVASAIYSNCGGSYLACPCSVVCGDAAPPTAELRFAFNYWASAKQ